MEIKVIKVFNRDVFLIGTDPIFYYFLRVDREGEA